MTDFLTLLLLFGVGSLAGFINVMAGGGSSITLPILIFLGLNSACANGTNRIAIFIQNISAIISFKQEKYSDFKTGIKLSMLAIPGALIGSLVAVRIDNVLFQKLLGLVIIGIMITIVLPRKTKQNIAENAKTSWIIYPVMVGIGFYGGFMQIGVGFMLMAALQNLLYLDLVRVNMHKVFIVFFYTIPAVIVFILTGNVNWLFGLCLAAGNATGAWWSAKISIKKGEKVIRIVLFVALFIMAIKLFLNR
jgi:uncharacterized protein